MRAYNRLVFAFFLMRDDVLVSNLDWAAELVVFTLEFRFTKDVAHQDMRVFVDSSRTSDWARVRLLLPLVDAFSTVMVLALFTFNRVFDDLKANLTEQESASFLFLLRESLSGPAHT